MDIQNKTPDPIQIIDHEFKHHGQVHPTIITVFPSMGDSVKVTAEGWEFSFPRLNEVQEIYRGPNLLGHLVREQMRVYIDPQEIAKKIIEARKQLLHEKTHGKENTAATTTHEDANQGPSEAAGSEVEEGRDTVPPVV